MEPNGRDEQRRWRRLALLPRAEEPEAGRSATPGADVVFVFSGKRGLDLADLALVLTARLQAGQQGRVWVKEIPVETWNLLRSLGLDHLFMVVPGTGDAPN
ncbi:MAG: hypothetical protein FIA95_12580 [Gemmatimonadetes bacterium]|nr:hypothetical protein [Gemmatimonadota bacterium]